MITIDIKLVCNKLEEFFTGFCRLNGVLDVGCRSYDTPEIAGYSAR
jgi:hypothetical protein